MGRLFWKFFFFIWLAQLTAIAGIGSTLSLKHQREQEAHAAADLLYAKEHPAMVLPPDVLSDVTPPDTTPAGELQARPDRPELLPRHISPPDRNNRLGITHPEPPEHLDHPGFRHDDRLGGDHGMPPPSPRWPREFDVFIPMAAVLLASLLFAALLAWYMSKPIRHLRTAFISLAEGNLQTRVGASMGRRQDELADLGREFDSMAEQLAHLMESQRRLLHDVSHELRSPLARLQAAIGLARQQPERVDASMDRIEREGVRMDKLVGELLTLSRIEAGVMASMDSIQVDELLAEIVDNAGFEAESQSKELVFSGSVMGQDVLLRGRYELLYRALENVVRNAIKYTRDNGIVRLEAQLEAAPLSVTQSSAAGAKQLRVRILDEGKGVPESELQTIFEPFFRGANASANSAAGAGRNADGYGLGLAIAQRVIFAHGGSIIASNLAQAGGAPGGLCVEIILPVLAKSTAL
ncbi:ATP-binding protein [Undibacterium sp. Rencai35W]|uniref:ATP-binding protein n=1 Tax=Undibacterium sp. Rencai35W TaxID=3413046 RepID=UPI003BF02D51